MNDQITLARQILAVRTERLEHSDPMASSELRVFQLSRIREAEQLVHELESKHADDFDN